MKKKNLAFTLAEVLIVIGIIGVVAALTLPNLNHATGDKEKVTKVKKIYSSLTEAFDRAQAIYGPYDTWFHESNCDDGGISQECNERVAKRITEFMKISKDCGFDEGCFSNNVSLDFEGNIISEKDLEEILQSFYNYYMVSLSSGEALAFSGNADFLNIVVDIDGPSKGKNQSGSDKFHFSCHNNLGTQNNILYPDLDCINYISEEQCIGNGNFIGDYSDLVTKWVIENGNLDYLKCPEELNWKTKTSCE